MLRTLRYPVMAAILMPLVACDDDDNGTDPNTAVTFTVTVENLSTTGTIATDRLDGIVPLSPGVFIVGNGGTLLFASGTSADIGTERLAEDGNVTPKLEALDDADDDDHVHGSFSAPAGDDGAMIGPGQTATFSFSARPGDRLQLMTMFAQSNDWFYAFGGGGLDLFNGSTPVTGDVTSSLVLYDAGTEEDVEPGEGPNQAPAQTAPNTGTADDNTSIRQATLVGFTIPATASVIRVTVSAQ